MLLNVRTSAIYNKTIRYGKKTYIQKHRGAMYFANNII